MEPPKSHKVLYSSDRPLPADLNQLPPGTSCKLCSCIPGVHVLFWYCPLVDGYICSSCCMEEVPSPDNLAEVQKHCPLASMETVSEICKSCGRNSFQE